MNHILTFIVLALIFILLTPGILLTLPHDTSDKLTIAIVHGIIYSLIVTFLLMNNIVI